MITPQPQSIYPFGMISLGWVAVAVLCSCYYDTRLWEWRALFAPLAILLVGVGRLVTLAVNSK